VVPVHAGLPFWTAQTAPHAPQLLTSSFVARSQPSLGEALQLPKLALHVMVQEPLTHFAVPFVLSQALPQTPQFFTSVEVSTSQPFEAPPSQFAYGVTHEATSQVPVRHVLIA
jgi:hypothetical protein